MTCYVYYIIKHISYPYIYNVPHTHIYINIITYFFMFQMLPIANVPLHIANCWPRNAPGSSAKEPLREPLIEPTCHSYRWDSLRFAENCEAYEALFSACAFSSSSSLRRVWISNSTWGFVWQVVRFLCPSLNQPDRSGFLCRFLFSYRATCRFRSRTSADSRTRFLSLLSAFECFRTQ